MMLTETISNYAEINTTMFLLLMQVCRYLCELNNIFHNDVDIFTIQSEHNYNYSLLTQVSHHTSRRDIVFRPANRGSDPAKVKVTHSSPSSFVVETCQDRLV